MKQKSFLFLSIIIGLICPLTITSAKCMKQNKTFIFCGNRNNGECVFVNHCTDDGKICRQKWNQLNNRGSMTTIGNRCIKKRKWCYIETCTISPTNDISNISTIIPTIPPTYKTITPTPSTSPNYISKPPTKQLTEQPSRSPSSSYTNPITTPIETEIGDNGDSGGGNLALFSLIGIPVLIACITNPKIIERWGITITKCIKCKNIKNDIGDTNDTNVTNQIDDDLSSFDSSPDS